MKQGLRAAAFLLFVAPLSVNAICINPFGCAPSTIEECRQAAVRMPTNSGVNVAIADCQEKFIYKPEREAKEKQERQRKERFSAAINSGRATLKDISAAIGEPPSCSTTRGPCSDVAGGPTSSQTGCTFHYWGTTACSRQFAPFVDYMVEVVGQDGLVVSYQATK